VESQLIPNFQYYVTGVANGNTDDIRDIMISSEWKPTEFVDFISQKNEHTKHYNALKIGKNDECKTFCSFQTK
jgi:hypothetical protein